MSALPWAEQLDVSGFVNPRAGTEVQFTQSQVPWQGRESVDVDLTLGEVLPVLGALLVRGLEPLQPLVCFAQGKL